MPPPSANRQIRVFVSSTFTDMKADRDYLVKFTFPQLRKLCESRGVTWGEVDLRWGVTDQEKAEGKVLPIVLAEIERCQPYFIGLLGERYGQVYRDDIPPDLAERFPWLRGHRDKSLTELEILHGVLNNENLSDHAFFYFRDPAYVERMSGAERADFVSEDLLSREKLTALKERIRQRYRDKRLKYPPREGYANPDALGEQVLADFTAIIDQLYPKEDVPDPLDQEATRHEAYARSRRLAFVGREDLLRRLDAHVSGSAANVFPSPPTGSDGVGGEGRGEVGNNNNPLLLTGESGCGKSALLAEWGARWRKDHPDDLIIQHYIGSTPDSADWQGLVRRILSELKRTFTITDDIPVQPDALRNALQEWTAKSADARRRVILVLDALNQLTDDGAARQLGWLPVVFPANFRVLVSTLPGESLEVLRKRGWPELNVPLFARADIAAAVLAYFKIFSKTPPPDIVAKLESTPAACNALYLRAVLDELRQFGKHEELKAKAT
jgi:ATPase involved in DNA replication initiation